MFKLTPVGYLLLYVDFNAWNAALNLGGYTPLSPTISTHLCTGHGDFLQHHEQEDEPWTVEDIFKMARSLTGQMSTAL